MLNRSHRCYCPCSHELLCPPSVTDTTTTSCSGVCSNSIGGRLKLADFGMATAYGEGVEGIGDGQEGDTLYMAKELLSSTARLPSADMFR